jgi:hypothetical protein
MKTTRSSSKGASPRIAQSKTKDSSPSVHNTLTAGDSDISRGGVATPFPWKLHECLEDSHKEGHEWIVNWQPHGRAFHVHKPKIFVEKIMPTYFNQSKVSPWEELSV